MNWPLRVLVVFSLVVGAGCIGDNAISTQESQSTTSLDETSTNTVSNSDRITSVLPPSGFVAGKVVTSVPEDAVITGSGDDRIKNVVPIQKAITQAAESGGSSTIDVKGKEVGNVQKALNSLPGYVGGEGPDGYYIRYENTVVVVYLAVDQ